MGPTFDAFNCAIIVVTRTDQKPAFSTCTFFLHRAIGNVLNKLHAYIFYDWHWRDCMQWYSACDASLSPNVMEWERTCKHARKEFAYERGGSGSVPASLQFLTQTVLG